MMTTRRNILAGAAGALLLPGMPAATAQLAPRPVKGGRAVWGVETEPSTLNPHLNGQAKAKLILRNAYESLLARTAEGGYVPWLATEYNVSEDGLVYSFVLRDDVTFTDGEKLDAAAVALNFTRLKDPGYSGSISAGHVSHVASARAADARTLVVTLAKPYAPFLDGAAQLEIISPKAFGSTQLKSGGKEIAGTGPFILDRYVRGQEIRFLRNPAYNWAPSVAQHQGPAYLDEITYRFLPESSVRTGALSSGQVDIIEGISGNDAALFKGDPEFAYQSALNTGTPYTLYLNTNYGPTQDVRVRKALIAAVDVETVVKSIYRGERTRAWGVLTPADRDFYDKSIERSYGFDARAANQLLDQAGWAARDANGFRTKDGARLVIEVVQSQATIRDQRDQLLQALQAQARQNAGIDLVLSYVDAGTYTDRQNSGKYGAIPNSTTGQENAVTLYFHYLPRRLGGSINYSRTEAPEVLAWLNDAAAILDHRKRFGIYASLQRSAVLEQAYGLPLYVPEDQIATSRKVHGAGFRPFKQLPENAYDIWIER
jgi:peptide/nickel transport system substrate-binding protein